MNSNFNLGNQQINPAPNPAPNLLPKLFGYYASVQDGIGSGDYINEMSGQANLVFIQSATLAEKLEKARGTNLKAVVTLHPYVFDDSTMLLYSDWQQRLQSLLLIAGDYQDTIAAFYPQDEPYLQAASKGISDSEMYDSLEKIGQFLKAKFPQIPIAVIFSSNEIKKNIPIPPSFDWFGIDCYSGFDNCEGVSIPNLFEKLDMKLRELDTQDGKRRQLMVVPPTGFDATCNICEANNVNQISQYREWLRFRSDIHIIMGFLWQSFNNEAGNWTGTRDSKQLSDGYTKFFLDFIGNKL